MHQNLTTFRVDHYAFLLPSYAYIDYFPLQNVTSNTRIRELINLMLDKKEHAPNLTVVYITYRPTSNFA